MNTTLRQRSICMPKGATKRLISSALWKGLESTSETNVYTYLEVLSLFENICKFCVVSFDNHKPTVREGPNNDLGRRTRDQEEEANSNSAGPAEERASVCKSFFE